MKFIEYEKGTVTYRTIDKNIANRIINLLRGFIFHRGVKDSEGVWTYLKFQKKYESQIINQINPLS